MATRRKKQDWQSGDLFSVTQLDGGSTLAQVISYEFHAMNSVVCAFSLRRGFSEIKSVPPLQVEEVICVQFVTVDALDDGTWRVVGHAPTVEVGDFLNIEDHRRRQFVGTKIIGSKAIETFLNACYELEAWDAFHDPSYFDKLLTSPELKPKRVMYKRHIV